MATKRIGNITLNYSVPEAQTQLYNAIGRTTGASTGSSSGGGDNFFTKKAKSIENALGTTFSAPVSLGKDIVENNSTSNMLSGFKGSIDDVYRKYGFKNRNDYDKQLYAAEDAGNQAEVDRLLNLPGLSEDLKAQANKNASEATAKAKNYEDYRNNSYVGQKINQDRGKFLGSAINTMSTATDILGLSNGPLSNAIQGGIEGVADELEQNGLENFDWGRAGQNALIGAASGAATGALNKGISNSLAKRAAAKGLTNTVAKNGIGNAIKQGVKTVAGGAARGALSGAVGGATGAGLQSALNGVDLGQGVMNTLQGAAQGAQQGAVTGGIMAGANAAINKTPGIGTFLKNVNQAQQDWKNSGSNFDERLTNTLTSGDSRVGDWLMNKRQSKVLGTMGNLGNRVQFIDDEFNLESIPGMSKNLQKYLGNMPRTPEYMEKEIEHARQYVNEYNNAADKTKTNFGYLSESPDGAKMVEAMRELAANGDTIMAEIGGNTQQTPTTANNLVDNTGRKIPPEIAQRLANIDPRLLDENGNIKVMYHGTPNGGFERFDDGTYFTADKEYADVYQNPSASSLMPKNGAKKPMTYDTYIDAKKLFDINDSDARKIYVDDYIKGGNANGIDPYRTSYDDVNNIDWTEAENLREFLNNNPQYGYDGIIVDEGGVPNDNGGVTYRGKSIIPMSGDQVIMRKGINQDQTPTTAKGWLKKAGQRIVEDAGNRGVGLSVKDVSSEMPEDIRNMQIRDYNANADGGTDTTYGIASDPRVRQQLLANVNAQLAENPNARIGDTNFDADAIISEYSERLTPEQYRNFNPIDAENALVQELQGLEASQGFTRPSSRQLTQATQVDPWDRLAQENGYRSYDDVVESYMRANPNAKINQNGMAGAITTWMDNNPGDWNPNQTVKNPRTAVYEALTSDNDGIQEAQVVPSKTSRETKMRYARGKELLAQYGAVDQPMARATKAAETFQKIADMGFTKPEDVEKISNAITGSNGAVSTLNRNIISSAKPVNTFDGAGEGQTMDDFIDNSIEHNMLSGTNQGKAVKRGINAYLRALPSHADGSVTFEDSAADTFKVVQNLEARAAELEGRGGSTYHRATTEDIHQAAVLKDVANLLKDRIYDGANVKVALTPAVSKELKAIDPGNKAWADTVDAFVSSAKTPQDLRSFQKPFVRASRYIDNQYVQAATAGGRMAANAGELPSVLPVTKAGWAKQALNTVWNSNAAHRARANIYNKLANNAAEKAATQTPSVETPVTANPMAATATETPIVDTPTPTTTQTANLASASTTNPAMNIYNAIGRYEGNNQNEQARVADYLSEANTNMAMAENANTYSEMPYMSTPSATTAEPTSSNASSSALATEVPTTTGTTSNVYFPETGDYWTDLLGRAMTSAINADDATAFGQLYEMYQNALSQQSASSSKDYSNPTNWSSADRTKLLNAQNALGQIDQLEQAYVDATGEGGSNAIQGWLRSRAADISGGNWDPSASNYNSLAGSVGMSIVKNLINLGVTEADAERYKKYIPSITDTKEQASTKLETLRQIYQNQINNLYGAYGL